MRIVSSLLFSLAFAALPVQAGTWFVSPQGDDGARGDAAHPFKTLARARDAARATAGADRIVLADGAYETETPFVLTAADHDLVFEAAAGARPVVSAGKTIAGWRVDARGRWHAPLPAHLQTTPAQFYVNGQRRQRPHLPRTGYFFVEKPGGAEPGTERERFICKPGDFPAGDNPGLEVCLFHTWTMSRSRVAAYAPETRRVTLDVPHFKRDYEAVSPHRWYRFDNVKSAFGAPGDWFADAAAGEVVYVPQAGETPAACTAVLSRHRHAVRLDDCTNVVFRGVVFAHADYGVRPGGNYVAQAAADQPGAVHAENARHVRLEGCAVLHTGAYGVVFTRGCTGCAVVGCELADLGAGGVRIGDGWEKTRKIVVSKGCAVEDCLVEGCGRVDPAGVGVWIGHGAGTHVAHNTIHDTYYSGISAGWHWSFATTARDNVLEWNHIYDIGQHVLSDMGGIYLLGRQPGTVERFNHVHHVTRARNCAFGIYFDSGTSLVTVTNNLVHDCGDCNWFMARISASNRVENNVFAYGPRHQLNNPPRQEGSCPSRFARNLVVWEGAHFMPNQPGPDVVDYADNLYFCPADEKPAKIRGFVYADPKFADGAKRDFRLVDETAARAIGFVPFSVADAGRRAPRAFTAGLPPVPRVFEEAPAAPKLPLAEDFETLDVGAAWPGMGYHPDTAKQYMRVTDKTAARGKKSLEITDALPGWTPHVCAYPLRTEGVQKIAFAMRVEKGAQPHFEVRDGDWWLAAPGPECRVLGGKLFARGRQLMDMPPDVWIDFELSFQLGTERRKDVFSLTVKVPGAAPRVFPDLPLDRKFRKVGWIGFQSCADKGVKYWIDDFRLTP